MRRCTPGLMGLLSLGLSLLFVGTLPAAEPVSASIAVLRSILDDERSIRQRKN